MMCTGRCTMQRKPVSARITPSHVRGWDWPCTMQRKPVSARITPSHIREWHWPLHDAAQTGFGLEITPSRVRGWDWPLHDAAQSRAQQPKLSSDSRDTCSSREQRQASSTNTCLPVTRPAPAAAVCEQYRAHGSSSSNAHVAPLYSSLMLDTARVQILETGVNPWLCIIFLARVLSLATD